MIALPAFEGIAPAGLAPVASLARTDRRWLLAPMLLVSLALLWGVLPRYLWPPIAGPEAAAPVKERAPVVAPGSLRTGLTEVPARRPTDTTAAKARRS